MNLNTSIIKKLIFLTGIIMFSAVSGASEIAKTEKIIKLVKTSGVYDFLESSYQGNNKIFKNLRKSSQEDIKSKYHSLPKEFWELEEKAYKKMQEDLKEFDITTDEYVRKWAGFYGDGLTVDEVTEILSYYNSTIGRKDLAAQAKASYKWNSYINDGYQEALERTTKEYSSKISKTAYSYAEKIKPIYLKV
jgi:hypothetical protein